MLKMSGKIISNIFFEASFRNNAENILILFYSYFNYHFATNLLFIHKKLLDKQRWHVLIVFLLKIYEIFFVFPSHFKLLSSIEMILQ